MPAVTPFDDALYTYAESADSGIILFFLIIYCVFAFAVLVFSVASYVLSSFGIYTIAKRRGIRKPWLSWIPYGNMWVLGSISDQYQYVTGGKIKNRRKVLLATTIALSALVIPMVIFAVLSGLGSYWSVAALVLVYVVFMVVAIVGAVFQYIAYYNLFRSCKPQNATLFLVVGIVCQATLPFFLFACRNHDEGMPPRKSQIQEPIPAPENIEE